MDHASLGNIKDFILNFEYDTTNQIFDIGVLILNPTIYVTLIICLELKKNGLSIETDKSGDRDINRVYCKECYGYDIKTGSGSYLKLMILIKENVEVNISVLGTNRMNSSMNLIDHMYKCSEMFRRYLMTTIHFIESC